MAASRANAVDADRNCKRHALRSPERGRRSRVGTRGILDRADDSDRRPARYVGRRRAAAGTARRGAARPVFDLESRSVASACRGRSNAERARSCALSTREPLESSVVGALAGARSSVSGDAALAERRQDWRRKPRPRSRVGGGCVACERHGRHRTGEPAFRVRGDDVRRGLRRLASCHSPPRTRGRAGSRCVWFCFRRARVRSRARARRNDGTHRGMSARVFADRDRPAGIRLGEGASRSAVVRLRVGDGRHPRRAHGDGAHTRDPLRRRRCNPGPGAMHAHGFAMAAS